MPLSSSRRRPLAILSRVRYPFDLSYGVITAVFKILNCGLTLTSYAFADHHTENLQIFEVNAWVNLDLYGTLVRGAKNGWTDCILD